MVLPKPVVIAGLLGAYVVGSLLTWYEMLTNREGYRRASAVPDKAMVNGRLA